MPYEILNHGVESAQYWQGCGTSFTAFDACVTGSGSNAAEAYADAVEQVYLNDSGAESLRLPTRPAGIRARDRVPANAGDETYWYVSIRWNAVLIPTAERYSENCR